MTTTSVTNAADRAVGAILRPGDTPKLLDDDIPQTPVSADLPSKSTRSRSKPKSQGSSDENMIGMDDIPLEDRKTLYKAIRYADGRVKWALPIGDVATDRQMGLEPQYVVFQSKGGAEQELLDASMKAWSESQTFNSLDTYLVQYQRLNLFLQLRQYADTPFDMPAPDEDGHYDQAAFTAYVAQASRKMGSIPYAAALKQLALFEKRLVSCILAIDTGTFLKAGR